MKAHLEWLVWLVIKSKMVARSGQFYMPFGSSGREQLHWSAGHQGSKKQMHPGNVTQIIVNPIRRIGHNPKHRGQLLYSCSHLKQTEAKASEATWPTKQETVMESGYTHWLVACSKHTIRIRIRFFKICQWIQWSPTNVYFSFLTAGYGHSLDMSCEYCFSFLYLRDFHKPQQVKVKIKAWIRQKSKQRIYRILYKKNIFSFFYLIILCPSRFILGLLSGPYPQLRNH